MEIKNSCKFLLVSPCRAEVAHGQAWATVEYHILALPRIQLRAVALSQPVNYIAECKRLLAELNYFFVFQSQNDCATYRSLHLPV